MNRKGSHAPLDEKFKIFEWLNLKIRLPKEQQLKAKDKNSVNFLLKLFLKALKTLCFSENKPYLQLASNLRKLELSLTELWIKTIVSNWH